MEGRELLTAVCRGMPRLLPCRRGGHTPGGCDVGGLCAVPCPVHSDCPMPGWVALPRAAEGDGVPALLLAPHAACKARTW